MTSERKSLPNEKASAPNLWLTKYLPIVIDAIEIQDMNTLRILLGPDYHQLTQSLDKKLYQSEPYIKNILEKSFFLKIEEAVDSLSKLYMDREILRKYEYKIINPLRARENKAVESNLRFKILRNSLKEIHEEIDMIKNSYDEDDVKGPLLEEKIQEKNNAKNKIQKIRSEIQIKEKILSEGESKLLDEYYAFREKYDAAYKKCIAGNPYHYEEIRPELLNDKLTSIYLDVNENVRIQYLNVFYYNQVIQSLRGYIKEILVPALEKELKQWINEHLSCIANYKKIDLKEIQEKYFNTHYQIYVKELNALAGYFFEKFTPMKEFEEDFEEFKEGDPSYQFDKFIQDVKQHNLALNKQFMQIVDQNQVITPDYIRNEKQKIQNQYEQDCYKTILKVKSHKLLELCKDKQAIDLLVKELAEFYENNYNPNNYKDINGNTLMHFSLVGLLQTGEYSFTKMYYQKIVSFLVERGFSLTDENNANETPLEYAYEHLIKQKKNSMLRTHFINWNFVVTVTQKMTVASEFLNELKTILLKYHDVVYSRCSLFYNNAITNSRLEDFFEILLVADKSYHKRDDSLVISLIESLTKTHDEQRAYERSAFYDSLKLLLAKKGPGNLNFIASTESLDKQKNSNNLESKYDK